MSSPKSIAPIVLLLLAVTASAEAFVANPAPEPASCLLLGGGLVGLAVLHRRRSRKS